MGCFHSKEGVLEPGERKGKNEASIKQYRKPRWKSQENLTPEKLQVTTACEPAAADVQGATDLVPYLCCQYLFMVPEVEQQHLDHVLVSSSSTSCILATVLQRMREEFWDTQVI